MSTMYSSITMLLKASTNTWKLLSDVKGGGGGGGGVGVDDKRWLV